MSQPSQTVVVLFRVSATTPSEAEWVVNERLSGLPVLKQNDSTDIALGTTDPIDTWTVVPVEGLLDESR